MYVQYLLFCGKPVAHCAELNQPTGLQGCVSWVESRPMGHESTSTSHEQMMLPWTASLEHMTS